MTSRGWVPPLNSVYDRSPESRIRRSIAVIDLRNLEPCCKYLCMRSSIVILALLCGCDESKPDYGPVQHTPNGVPVILDASTMADKDPEHTLAAVDIRVAQWVAEKASWGLAGYTDDELYAIAKSEVVIVFGTSLVTGDGARQYVGYNWYGACIEISYGLPHVYGPCVYDPADVAAQYNYEATPLYHLKHELTHSALRDWHP
jgi:hypothetical protein